MQVQFTTEQEAQLSVLAEHHGVDTERLVKEAALQLLHEDAQFRESVQAGIGAADRGELIEHADVWKNVEAILKF